MFVYIQNHIYCSYVLHTTHIKCVLNISLSTHSVYIDKSCRKKLANIGHFFNPFFCSLLACVAAVTRSIT